MTFATHNRGHRQVNGIWIRRPTLRMEPAGAPSQLGGCARFRPRPVRMHEAGRQLTWRAYRFIITASE